MVSEPASFVGRQAALCIRFRDQAVHNQLVPFREVTLVSVEREDDSFVYFKLGPFYDFSQAGALVDFAVPLPSSDGSPAHDLLMFEADAALTSVVSEERDAEMWGRFGELVAAEKTLPIAQEAKTGVFVHFRTPTATRLAVVGEIGTSFTSGAKFGASLPEQSTHELVVLHRIPHLIGTHGSIQPVGALVNATNFEVAPKRLSVSGNYGRHVVTITALRASAAWEDISIEPDVPEVRSASGDAIHLTPLSIPLRGTVDWFYRLKNRWFPLLLLAVAIGINGVVGGWGVIAKHPVLWVLVFLSAIAVSGSVLKIRE